MTIRNRLLAFTDRLQRIQLLLAAIALIVLMLITVTDVFLRYLFNSPVRGSYDLVECTLLVFVFNGMAAGFFQRRNIVIDLIDSAVGRVGTEILVRIADILSVVCLGLLFWAMLGPARQAFEYGDRKLELNLPIYVLWIAALAALTGTIFCALVVLFARPAVSHGRPAA
jgi:TRAP-type transport system small permease protein